MLLEPEGALLLVAEILDGLAIPYAVGGSVASSRYGEVRATQDIDVVIDLRLSKVKPLVAALTPKFYVDAPAVLSAVERSGSFQALHWDWLVKLDFYVLGESAFDRQQLERRVPLRLGGDGGRDVWFCSAEDTVLAKLVWYRKSGGVLERQLRDVTGVLKAQRDRIDRAYLESNALHLGVEDLLARCVADAGLAS